MRIKNVSHIFTLSNRKELVALKDINLTIDNGSFVVILGESGCGKTTLLNLLAGFLHPTSGIIWVDNEKVAAPHFSRTLLFQHPCLLPWLNIRDNIAFGCKLRGEKERLREKVSRFLKLMGLEDFINDYPNELSAGMAQRVALARALMGEAEVLLLDEPFAALDFFNKNRIQKELINLWRTHNFTAVFVTHCIDEALLLGEKIVIMGNKPGHIEYILDVDHDYPRDLTAKKLVDLEVEISGYVKGLGLI